MLLTLPHYFCPEYDMLCRPTPLPRSYFAYFLHLYLFQHPATKILERLSLPDIPWSPTDVPKDEWP